MSKHIYTLVKNHMCC